MPPSETRRIFVQPGELYVCRVPALLGTIVGSCIAVSIYDWRERCGGMCHFMLPGKGRNEQPSPRFGEDAMRLLLERMRAFEPGVRSGLVAHVVGGACVLPAFSGRAHHLGLQNADLALQCLAAAGVAVETRVVGGGRGRKLEFDTGTGALSLREIQPAASG